MTDTERLNEIRRKRPKLWFETGIGYTPGRWIVEGRWGHAGESPSLRKAIDEWARGSDGEEEELD